MANKRKGWSIAEGHKYVADVDDKILRRQAADKERAKRGESVNMDLLHESKRRRQLYNENPNAFRDSSVLYYRNKDDGYMGLNDRRGSPKDKDYAKKALEKAFDEDKNKKERLEKRKQKW